MQLVNEVVEYSETDHADHFKMLLEKYNQFYRQTVQADQASVIALDNIDTDASVRMAALEKLQASAEPFNKFLAKYFEENKQSENLTGRDRLFFHYVKCF